MASIILGSEGADTLRDLSATLRRKTLDLSVGLDGPVYAHYTPWLCVRPVLDRGLADFAICTARYLPGSVMTSQHYLQDVNRFLEVHSALTRDLLIGRHEDWQLLENVNQRPEVVPMLAEAIGLIQGTAEFWRTSYPALVDMVLPLKQPRPRGWTCHYARGAVFLGFASQYSIFNLALDLVHEMGHQALALFQSADRLIAGDLNAPVYSEVRRTYRPAIQSLQATAAIAFMTCFAEDAGVPRYMHPEFDDSLPEALMRATAHLRQACRFTDVGEQIMGDFEEVFARCLGSDGSAVSEVLPIRTPPINLPTAGPTA